MGANRVSTAGIGSAVPPKVRALCQTLHDAGFRAWVVGGCVRDELLAELRANSSGAEAHTLRNDWDIATSALPKQVMSLFPRVIPTGLQHGTVTVVMGRDGYEVTTLRGESSYSDGRRPDVVYFVDDIRADLARRDFTINAIAYDPLEDRLIDPFGGLDDLTRGYLRAVGTPSERFGEDGLRVLRAARFVAVLQLELDANTAHAIEPSLNSYRKVSTERIREEWIKAMKARRPSQAFEVMRQHGMLAITAPELLDLVGCEQNHYHAYDVWDHTMRCLDACPATPLLRMAALLHDIGKPRVREFSKKTNNYTFHQHEIIGETLASDILQRLRFSNDDRTHIAALVRHHLLCYEPSWSDAAVRRWLRRVGSHLVKDLYALGRADCVAKGRLPDADLAQIEALETRVSAILAAGAALSVRDLAISGQDLIRAGMLPGPRMGEVLRQLLDEVTENPSLNHRQSLLERARELEASPLEIT